MDDQWMFDAFEGDDHDGDELPACRRPLDKVRVAVARKAYAKYFDVEDMMYMFTARVDGLPLLHHYKHYHTRGYLIIDDDGSPYSWTAPPRADDRPKGWDDGWDDGIDDGSDELDHDIDDRGTFSALPSLSEALDGLMLFQLPWMKEGLEPERRGLAWDDRHEHPAAKAWSRRRMATFRRMYVDASAGDGG